MEKFLDRVKGRESDSTVLRDKFGNPVIAPPGPEGGWTLDGARPVKDKEDSAKYEIDEYSGYEKNND